MFCCMADDSPDDGGGGNDPAPPPYYPDNPNVPDPEPDPEPDPPNNEDDYTGRPDDAPDPDDLPPAGPPDDGSITPDEPPVSNPDTPDDFYPPTYPDDPIDEIGDPSDDFFEDIQDEIDSLPPIDDDTTDDDYTGRPDDAPMPPPPPVDDDEVDDDFDFVTPPVDITPKEPKPMPPDIVYYPDGTWLNTITGETGVWDTGDNNDDEQPGTPDDPIANPEPPTISPPTIPPPTVLPKLPKPKPPAVIDPPDEDDDPPGSVITPSPEPDLETDGDVRDAERAFGQRRKRRPGRMRPQRTILGSATDYTGGNISKKSLLGQNNGNS